MEEICYQCTISIKKEQLVRCSNSKCEKSFHAGCAVQALGLPDGVLDSCCGVHRSLRGSAPSQSGSQLIQDKNKSSGIIDDMLLRFRDIMLLRKVKKYPLWKNR